MHDVVSQIVFPCGDEDLGARDLVGTIGLGLGLGLDLAQVGATLGFSQAHGAGPFATDQTRHVQILLCLRAELHDGVHAPQAQAGIHGERPVGRAHHFRLDEVQRHGQFLATVLFGVRQALPTARHVLGVGFLEALGCGDHAVVNGAAFLITAQVQWGQHFFAEGGGTLHDGLHHVGRGVGTVGQFGVMAGVVKYLVHQEAHIAQGGFVLRHGAPRARTFEWGRI